jgi:hypothetical protein
MGDVSGGGDGDRDEDAPEELRLDLLPPLPQSATIRSVASRLWRDGRVAAIWLGGSLAEGAGDAYSDIDLRIAVAQQDLAAWHAPDFAALLDNPVLGRHFLRLGEGSFLHHLILGNGDIIDFLVQDADMPPETEPLLVLGCRSDACAERLTDADRAQATSEALVTGAALRELIVTFWIHSHKHRKVLYRDLDLMFPAALYANWTMLMRLWYIAATGRDTAARHFSGIHGLSELVRTIEEAFGREPLAACGMPARTREEICDVIERHRDIVSSLGHRLAERHGVDYPAELEAMVRAAWARFRAATTTSPAAQ